MYSKWTNCFRSVYDNAHKLPHQLHVPLCVTTRSYKFVYPLFETARLQLSASPSLQFFVR